MSFDTGMPIGSQAILAILLGEIEFVNPDITGGLAISHDLGQVFLERGQRLGVSPVAHHRAGCDIDFRVRIMLAHTGNERFICFGPGFLFRDAFSKIVGGKIDEHHLGVHS